MIYINQINQLCRNYRIRDLETSDEDADETDEGKLNKGKEDHQEAEEDVPITRYVGDINQNDNDDYDDNNGQAIHIHGSNPATGWRSLCVVNKTKANCDHGKHLEDKKVEEDDTIKKDERGI